MPADSDPNNWGALSPDEIALSERFLEDGFVICDVDDRIALDAIRQSVIGLLQERCDCESLDEKDLLDRFHEICKVDDLNEIRVALMQLLNQEVLTLPRYFSLAKNALETLVGNELVMQKRLNLSIQLPGDTSSLLPIHADVWSGDSPYEVVVWTPLVNCFESKSMFILPPAETKILHKDFREKSSEDVFRAVESDLVWLEVPYGKTVVFNQNLPHGNRINIERETRWSLNCRFKSIFAPYRDKKVGEFFVPITLRAASRIGMAYQFPASR